MADIMASIMAAIFVGVLLMVGLLVYGITSDAMLHDPFFPNELVISGGGVAGCSEDAGHTATCVGTVNNPDIGNTTRAQPVVRNCTSTGTSCQTLTVSSDYNMSPTGVLTVLLTVNNGSIYVDYYQDVATDTTDLAQQSITTTTYSGFELASVLIIVIAAVAVIGGIFLIGKP